jgi:hypothetical protein
MSRVPRDRARVKHMALARLHGGPLDGQIIPLDDADDKLIVPYSETQVVYNRRGDEQNTGSDDGPTEIDYWFDESLEDLTSSDD